MPVTLANARQWAAEIGTHPIFDIVRGCLTIARYACLMRSSTVQGWALPVGVSRDIGASEIPVTDHDSVRRNATNCSPGHRGELKQALRDAEGSVEDRHIHFNLEEPDHAGTAVSPGSSKGDETKSKIVSFLAPAYRIFLL